MSESVRGFPGSCLWWDGVNHTGTFSFLRHLAAPRDVIVVGIDVVPKDSHCGCLQFCPGRVLKNLKLFKLIHRFVQIGYGE